MKTVFITICMDIMRRNIIETDFWRMFRNSTDVRVVFIVEEGKAGHYREHFNEKNVEVWELSSSGSMSTIQRAIFFFMRLAIKTESVAFYVMRAREDGGIGMFDAWFKMSLNRIFADSVWYKRCLRWCFARTTSSLKIKELFETYKPDLVMPLSVISYNFDALVMNEAKRRSIRTVGMTRSWDNLTSHGLVATLPDRFIFQNKFLKEMAHMHQNVSEHGETDIIGLPHYDLYKNPENFLEDRTAFFARVGLDPDKKLIFYVGADMHRSEQAFPSLFEKIIEKGDIIGLIQVVYRPHPSSLVDIEQVGRMRHVILDVVFQKREGGGGATTFDTANYINYLYHADVIVNAASTASIDAAVFGKPAVCLNFDMGAEFPYWLRAERMYDNWTHYIYLVKTGGVRLVHSTKELIEVVNDYLADPSKDVEGRARLLELLVEPFDGGAGKRLAQIMIDEVRDLR